MIHSKRIGILGTPLKLLRNGLAKPLVICKETPNNIENIKENSHLFLFEQCKRP